MVGGPQFGTGQQGDQIGALDRLRKPSGIRGQVFECIDCRLDEDRGDRNCGQFLGFKISSEQTEALEMLSGEIMESAQPSERVRQSLAPQVFTDIEAGQHLGAILKVHGRDLLTACAIQQGCTLAQTGRGIVYEVRHAHNPYVTADGTAVEAGAADAPHVAAEASCNAADAGPAEVDDGASEAGSDTFDILCGLDDEYSALCLDGVLDFRRADLGDGEGPFNAVAGAAGSTYGVRDLATSGGMDTDEMQVSPPTPPRKNNTPPHHHQWNGDQRRVLWEFAVQRWGGIYGASPAHIYRWRHEHDPNANQDGLSLVTCTHGTLVFLFKMPYTCPLGDPSSYHVVEVVLEKGDTFIFLGGSGTQVRHGLCAPYGPAGWMVLDVVVVAPPAIP